MKLSQSKEHTLGCREEKDSGIGACGQTLNTKQPPNRSSMDGESFGPRRKPSRFSTSQCDQAICKEMLEHQIV